MGQNPRPGVGIQRTTVTKNVGITKDSVPASPSVRSLKGMISRTSCARRDEARNKSHSLPRCDLVWLAVRRAAHRQTTRAGEPTRLRQETAREGRADDHRLCILEQNFAQSGWCGGDELASIKRERFKINGKWAAKIIYYQKLVI
ncbi:uncharacterized protein KNAG_0D04570 [Huiozyma naganishii CBS 8797]|uniref:Uncharacterized protein n=1 Tax=Huiozyma naganishii (strain ATCC MYA-139 / BCRC 22969 / CBS 8797 / KCTC 17520 / NBRC 10181 / NCYC 3082 / Yp74L-3) TaxID=1071383 RepID=J7RYG3_HUIN7|nr:hypothetical protein KNAG_0D04570 [Kazachstania naganishii CBS 8797]CCK70202.1 hypothetical protein KNAG_0D04570 [Kazachstania naganishii CBS 8797]